MADTGSGRANTKWQWLIFSVITVIFIFTYYLLFAGFNGTDDLHYAMLSANLLRGSYTPFDQFNITSGRFLLIAWQALIYKLLGINVFATQAGTIVASIVACYLTVFYLIKPSGRFTTAMATSLIYFNPVLFSSIQGIMPDVYIMLTCIILLILLKAVYEEKSPAKYYYRKVFLMVWIIFLSLFIKEIAILFLPWACILVVSKNKSEFYLLGAFMLTLFLVLLFVTGIVYYLNTGQFFFKVTQIENNEYVPVPASLFPRLTYQFWLNLLLFGFYPVILGVGILVFQTVKKGRHLFRNNFFALAYLMLLIIACYFPFSFNRYYPMVPKARHFLFLLPLSVAFITPYLENILMNKKSPLLLAVSALLLILCVANTENKWKWMIYTFIFLMFFLLYFVNRLSPVFGCIGFIFVFWISILEPVYLSKPKWFNDLKQLSGTLKANSYYFPEHDNMTHWYLFHQFDTGQGRIFNLDTLRSRRLSQYFVQLNETSFTPGWLIVNPVYSVRAKRFFNSVDSLDRSSYFSNHIKQGAIQAFYLDSISQVYYVRDLISREYSGNPGNRFY